MPINQNGDMSTENFNYADIYINIGKQFDFPKKLAEQDKKQYEDFATRYIMEKIAELLSEDYRGVYK